MGRPRLSTCSLPRHSIRIHMPPKRASHSLPPSLPSYLLQTHPMLITIPDVLYPQRNRRQLPLPHHNRHLRRNRRRLQSLHPDRYNRLPLLRRQHPRQHRIHVPHRSSQYHRPPRHRHPSNVLVPAANPPLPREYRRMFEVASAPPHASRKQPE